MQKWLMMVVQATESLSSPAIKMVGLVVMVWKLVQGLFFIDFRWMKSYKQWRGGYMEEVKFSMYDIILKGMNAWHGHAVGHLWNSIDAEQQRHIKNHIGFHYVPKDTLDDGWHLDVEGNAFANYRASASMRPYEDYGGDWLIFGERIFEPIYWVYSLMQFGLGEEYRGFFSKRDALHYQKQQRESGYYFDAILLHMRVANRQDYVPFELRYPVQEIMEKKYLNSQGAKDRLHRQGFQDYFIQYLHNLLYHNYLRGSEDDRTFWWDRLNDLEEVKKEIDPYYPNCLFHLYELLDIAYDYFYDGGCTDITYFK